MKRGREFIICGNDNRKTAALNCAAATFFRFLVIVMAVLQDTHNSTLNDIEHIVEQSVIHITAVDNTTTVLREEEFLRMLRRRISLVKLRFHQCLKIHEKPSLNTITNTGIIAYFLNPVSIFYRFFTKILYSVHTTLKFKEKSNERKNLSTTLLAYNLTEYACSFFLHGFRVMRVEILRNCRIFVIEAGGNVHWFCPCFDETCRMGMTKAVRI